MDRPVIVYVHANSGPVPAAHYNFFMSRCERELLKLQQEKRILASKLEGKDRELTEARQLNGNLRATIEALEARHPVPTPPTMAAEPPAPIVPMTTEFPVEQTGKAVQLLPPPEKPIPVELKPLYEVLRANMTLTKVRK